MRDGTIVTLLVEDNPGDARLIQEALSEIVQPHFHLKRVENLAGAREALAQQDFAAIFLDLSLPDSQGMNTVRQIELAAPDVPLIVLTGLDDEALAVEAVRSGAQDYLVKSDVTPHLLARVARYAIERQRLVTERRQSEESLRLAAKVFESSTEGIVITDTAGHILRVNAAFTEITGYPFPEIAGETPRLLKSGRHDTDFYRKMWTSLQADGRWQGEIWNKRKNGEVYPEWMNIGSVKNDMGETTHFVGTFSDITQRKAAEERIRFLSNYDALTGLPNRGLLQDRVTQALNAAKHLNSKAALLMIDLDRFKNINESLNHDFGDLLLQLVGQRLANCTRAIDTLARSGGDEFVILMPEIRHAGEVAAMANSVLSAMNQPFQLDTNEINITSSIGISVFPSDGDNGQILMKNSDVAMYRAKELGRNNYQFYTQDMNARTFETLAMENSLRHALKRQEFRLHYQPQIDIASGAIIGMEALIRLQHPETGMVPPGSFIPLAEETGLIVPIGEWVLNEACFQTKEWHDQGHAGLRVAVNLSAHQFRHKGLLDSVSRALDESGLPPGKLELELTESILMHDTEEIIATLHQFKRMGVQLSIDDFGTGFSSLAYLKRFDMDKLKIDQSFVRDITSDPNDLAIARAVIALGHSLNLKVIAEGVETAEQLALLKEYGCDEMQGFYFSRPRPAAEILPLLQGIRGVST